MVLTSEFNVEFDGEHAGGGWVAVVCLYGILGCVV